MEETIQVLFLAFCGVVLTFALLFVFCWCLISCSFFCLKYFYCANLNKLVSVLSFGNSNSSEVSSEISSEDFEEEFDCSNSHLQELSTHHHHPEEYLRRHGHISREDPSSGYYLRETGSSLRKARPEEPPIYDFPPPYETLFPQVHVATLTRSIDRDREQDQVEEVLVSSGGTPV